MAETRSRDAAASTDQAHDLAPVPASARKWMFALAVALPLAITGIALAYGLATDGPQRTVAGSVAATWFAALASVGLASTALWLGFDRLLRRHHLHVGSDGIDVRTTFYRRRVALDELQIDQARVVTLAERPEFRPLLKLNGAALPGCRSGWFLLRNRSRAFVATSGGPRVLWLPTRQGAALLLQPRQPQALLDRLRELADASARR
jgi:hypothetical protein